jgi:hypothetical protein
MHTHSFGLSEIDRAIRTLAGRVAGEQAVSVSIDPTLAPTLAHQSWGRPAA